MKCTFDDARLRSLYPSPTGDYRVLIAVAVTVAVVCRRGSTVYIDVVRGRHGPGHLLLRLTYTPTGIIYAHFAMYF